jgi:hypothetical protein
MSWLFELHKTQPIAHAVGVLAKVYPLTTLLRILSAQVLAITLFR